MTKSKNTPEKKGKQEESAIVKKKKPKEENDKFSPGEPDDYNAEEFSTD